MSCLLTYPAYYRIIRREGGTWFFKRAKLLCSASHLSTPAEATDFEAQHNLTKNQVAIELFRINGGKSGYYLANLRNRQYYYCGLKFSDVQTKLQSLGIGRPDCD